MGVVGSLKQKINNCFEQQDTLEYNQLYTMINGDQKYIENQKWFRFNKDKVLFDYNIFVFAYTDYEIDQEQMQKNWNSIKFNLGQVPFTRNSSQVLCLKLKYAIRKGVPCTKFKLFISQLFHINFNSVKQEEYNKNLNFIFKGKIPDSFYQVPLFGIDADNINVAIKTPCINIQGVKAISRMLWIFNKTKTMQFNPFLLHVCSLLIIFLQEREAYKVLQYMIDDSINLHIKNQQCLRWHFTINRSHYSKLAQICFEQIKQVSKTFAYLMEHLNKYNINKQLLFQQLTKDFFFGFLPFSFIIKIFAIYLNQGIKIFFRIIYAMFKTWNNEIRTVQNLEKLKLLFKEKGLMLKRYEINKMIKIGSSLSLHKLNRNFHQYNDKLAEKHNEMYFFPVLEGESQFLNSEQFQMIWGYLPSIFKHYDPIKIFPADNYGYSSSQLCLCLSKYPNKGVLLMIQDTNQNVFGVFFQNNYNQKSQDFYFGTSETFLIILVPELKVYKSSGLNLTYCRIDESDKTLLFGSSDQGPALHIDKQLRKGYSYKSQTFKNSRLNNDELPEFKIKCLQCFILQ